MFTTIQKLKHFLHTAFSNADQSYGPSPPGSTPYMGLLQVNGAAVTRWTAVRSVIVDTMCNLGFGYQTATAITNVLFHLVCFEFVDVADLVQSGTTNDTCARDVITSMQYALDHWDGLLRATGSALEKSKSYWYLLDYSWCRTNWKLKPLSATPGDIFLHNDMTGARELIDRLPVTSARKAFGIFTRPDGCMTQQKVNLRQKAETWATAVRVHQFCEDDLWYALNATIMKSIEYPLVTTTFSHKECTHVMAPILTSSLSSLRIQLQLLQILVYTPHKYQGLGLHDPWFSQLIAHIHVILHHTSHSTTTGSLLHSNMENLILELGSATPFWSLSYYHWSALATPSWITHTWHDLLKTELHITGPPPSLSPHCQHDRAFMDVFVAHDFPPKTLQSLNHTRMFKQFIFVSNITSANGTPLDALVLTPTVPTKPTPYSWPCCRWPTPEAMLLWTQSIKTCFLPPHPGNQRLRLPLGPWRNNFPVGWEWWYSPTTSSIF